MPPAVNDIDAKSSASYKSTHSSRSSVLERAREYSRRLDSRNERAKSLERQSNASSPNSSGKSPRSKSAGRPSPRAVGNRPATRQHAMASVRNDAFQQQQPQQRPQQQSQQNGLHQQSPQQHVQQQMAHTRPQSSTPRTQSSTNSGRNSSAVQSQQSRQSQPRQSRQTQPRTAQGQQAHQTQPSPSGNSLRSRQTQNTQGEASGGSESAPVVPPELLVDALAGRDDGLLAIAECLMERYEGGYDVMGEAIIDAFADVQKLFAHVVEAAHLEGAAHEAAMKEEEIQELRRQLEAAGGAVEGGDSRRAPVSPAAAEDTRIAEFIDEDVKECLSAAIRDSAKFKANGSAPANYEGMFRLFERACQSASSLLPVDSDHRGRLQLSISRAESLGPERACTILRYSMDDVLRSGMRRVALPDVSKRADVVLSKPKPHASTHGGAGGQMGVAQSSEEALASLVEELKEVLGAPVYEDTPLQDVARRFWVALGDAQKAQMRNEERLEQNLGKLKGDFLLARAEWEEKLTFSQEEAAAFKKKYEFLRNQRYMNDARTTTGGMGDDRDASFYDSRNTSRGESTRSGRSGVESVASIGNGLANHARSLVGSFACSGINDRSGNVLYDELAENREDMRYDERRRRYGQQPQNISTANSYASHTSHNSRSSRSGKHPEGRSFRQYSPQRVDV